MGKMKLRELYKLALEDEVLPIKVLVPDTYDIAAKALQNKPEEARVSEWQHTVGEMRYEYNIHTGEVAKQLQKAYDEGARAGNPKLVRLYSKKDLETLILKEQAA